MTFKGVEGYVGKRLRTSAVCDKLRFSSYMFIVGIIHNF